MNNRVQLSTHDANRLATMMLQLPFSGVGGLFALELSGLPEISKTMTLAIDLCTNVKTIKQVKEDLLTGRVSAHQALCGIIKDWIKKNKSGARLDDLISAVSSNGLNFDDLTSSEFHCHTPKGGGQQVGGEVAGCSAVSLVPGNPSNCKRLRATEENGCSSSAAVDDNRCGLGAMEKPLANLVIIREIFKNLDDKSQKKFLQVCRAWRNECLGLWRKDQVIKLFEFDDNIQIIEMRTKEKIFHYRTSETKLDISPILPWPCLREYYKRFLKQKDLTPVENKHSLVEQPFRSFSITSAVIAPLTSASSPLMKFFWSVLAPHVTRLELDGCSILGGEGIETMRWLLLKGCPQLEVLQMKDCTESNISENIAVDREACATLAVGHIAKYFHSMHLDKDYSCAFQNTLDVIPNLKELSVSNTFDFSKLYEPISDKRPFPITKLEFEYRQTFANNYDDFHFSQYCQTSPNTIQELTVRVTMFKDSPADFVSRFFSGIAHCKQLRKLNINYRKSDHPCLGFLTPFRAMKLPNLTTFCIDGCYYDYEKSREESLLDATFDLKTIAGMPNLEFLNVSVQYYNRIDKWIAIEAEPAHQIRFEGMEKEDSVNGRSGSVNLKSLYFNGGKWHKPSPVEVERICQWGVNLERINGYPLRELLSVESG